MLPSNQNMVLKVHLLLKDADWVRNN